MKRFKTKQNLPKKIVISGYYGFDNFGDETILSVLVQKLKEFTPFITVLSSHPEKTKQLYKVGSIFFFCPCIFIFNIAKCDILISGGGSLLQDATSIKSLLYYLWVINIALFFRKKVIIFAQGIGPINNKFGAFLTKKTLQKCTLVTVRDRKSRMILTKWGINVDLVCDPLFDLPLIESTPTNKVGVQLRSFKTLTDELLRKLAKQVNKDFPDREIEIFSFQDHLDLAVCQKFEKMLKEINPDIKTSLVFNQSSNGMLKKISELEYMIAMRFHAVLVALKYGIKTFAISYDIKVEKLAEDAQIPCVSMAATEDYESLFAQLKNLDKNKLIEFSNSNHFDWSKIEELIK